MVHPTPMSPREVRCDTCTAHPGSPCLDLDTGGAGPRRDAFHGARWQAFEVAGGAKAVPMSAAERARRA